MVSYLYISSYQNKNKVKRSRFLTCFSTVSNFMKVSLKPLFWKPRNIISPRQYEKRLHNVLLILENGVDLLIHKRAIQTIKPIDGTSPMSINVVTLENWLIHNPPILSSQWSVTCFTKEDFQSPRLP